MRRETLTRLVDCLFSRGVEQKAERRIAERDSVLARSVAARFSRGNVLIQNERFETPESFAEKVSSVKKKRAFKL